MDESDWQPEQIAADLRLHAALRYAEKHFFDLLTAASNNQQPHVLMALRQQPVYAVAEFLYLWRAYRITTKEQVQGYIAYHNSRLAELLQDKERLRLYGFTPARLKNAHIDEPAAAKLVINYTNFGGSFDQRDLARLLVEQMSPETCRKTVAKLSETGFVQKEVGVYNSIIVKSAGTLEDIFMTHIRQFRTSLEEGGQPKKKGKR